MTHRCHPGWRRTVQLTGGVAGHAYDAIAPSEAEYRIPVKGPLPTWKLDDVTIDLQARIDAMFAPADRG